MSIMLPGYDDGKLPSKYGGYGGDEWDSTDWGQTGSGSAQFGDMDVDIGYYKPGGWDEWGLGIPTGFYFTPGKSSSSSSSSFVTGTQAGNKRTLGFGGSYGPSDAKKMKYTPGGKKDLLSLPDVGSQLKGKMSGRAIQGFPGPFRTKRVNAILGEEMHETRKIYLRRMVGRIIPSAKLRNANKFKPVTMLFGDVLAENDITTGVEDTNSMTISAGDSAAIKDNFALSSTQVQWGTNRYGDLCMNNCMSTNSSNGVQDTLLNARFVLQNVWSGVAAGGAFGLSLPAIASTNGSTFTQAYEDHKNFYPRVACSATEVPSGLEALFKYESEVVVHNPMNYACQVEAYVVLPKYANIQENPAIFWDTSEQERQYEGFVGSNAANVGGAVAWVPQLQPTYKSDLSRSPVQSQAFNDIYRIHDKKTVVIGAGHTAKFVSSVPWSLLKRDVLEKEPTLPGVTHYVWLRFCSPQLYNNDSHALLNTCGTAVVQQFERIMVKPIEPVTVPKIYNFIRHTAENSMDITKNSFVQPDGNLVTPGAKAAMDA